MSDLFNPKDDGRVFLGSSKVPTDISTPPFNILFTDPDKQVGRFYEKDGELHFEGNASESAKVFIRDVVAQYGSEIHSLEQERDELKKRVGELERLIMLHKKTTHERPDMIGTEIANIYLWESLEKGEK